MELTSRQQNDATRPDQQRPPKLAHLVMPAGAEESISRGRVIRGNEIW